ncbi:hypothetical protein Tco_0985055 [Tanacetum coccineum]
MLQQAVGILADPKEKKLKEMESEGSGFHGSTSMETPNNSNNGSSVEEIGVEPDKDQVTVRVSFPIDTHPISNVIQAFKEAQIRIVDLKIGAANNNVFHIYIIKSK